MAGVFVGNFRKHPLEEPESYFVGVVLSSFSLQRSTKSENNIDIIANGMTVASEKINKIRNKSYLCSKYGYGFRQYFALMTLTPLKGTAKTLAAISLGFRTQSGILAVPIHKFYPQKGTTSFPAIIIVEHPCGICTHLIKGKV